MLRAVLVGVLAVSASSCGGERDAPKVAAGAPAGTVVQVSGTVVATREGKPRDLVSGGVVYGDDEIATSSDGSVVIELAHNGARWSLEGDARARVDRSAAWGLARQAGATKAVDHATSAAGREGERTAADTRATTEATAAAPASAETGVATAPATPPAVESRPPAAEKSPPRAVVPPPSEDGNATLRASPPPPPEQRARRESESEIGGIGGATPEPVESEKQDRAAPKRAAPRSAVEPAPELERDAKRAAITTAPADPAQVRALVVAQRAELAKCLAASAPRLTLALRVSAGAPTFELRGGTATEEVRRCIAGVVARISFPATDAEVTLELRR
ncbi:MAG: hypothetical protein ACTHU0_03700 [Kofleriaceae bacterium]